MKIPSLAAVALIAIVITVIPRVSTADPCSSLSERACYHSKTCSLDCELTTKQPIHCVGGEVYHCREKRGKCEAGLAQADDMKEKCESRSGCKFVPPDCFCGVSIDGTGVCACGGGPPPKCEEK